ncbi:MAG: BatD family protein [Minicystis sp.]
MIALAAARTFLRGPWIAIAAALLFGLFFAGGARADAPPRLSVRQSAQQVEVGEALVIELSATMENGDTAPSDPQLRAPPAFSVDGPSISTQTTMTGFGARMQVSVTIGATWRLVSRTPGRYTIPAPSMQWKGKRLTGTAVTVEVVPATGRSRQPPQSNNPFLMPGGPGWGFPGFPGFPRDPMDEDLEDAPTVPDLGLPHVPERNVFVRAIADKRNVVVGEQVTISFYVYFRPDYHARNISQHEASFPDFIRVPLLKNPGIERPVRATVGGQVWKAKLFDKLAAFPMKAGDLHTGSMSVTFVDPRIGRFDRASEDLVIRVSEPPRTGRPAGYMLGDVGKFSLSATVTPRRIEQGGAVAVSLVVSGTGNPPMALRLPERTGIEWLEPERKESIEPQGNVVNGSRTFGYVVRIGESGAVDLGEVTLPYWDPSTKTYQVARAKLGTIDVTPTTQLSADGGAPIPFQEPKADPFAALPAARSTLGAYTPPRSRLFDGGVLWLLVAAPPLLVGAFSAGSGAVRRAKARRAQAADAPATLAAKALRDAAEAEARGDTKALAAGLDRAVHLAIEAACGLKSRGVLLADLPDEIAQRGLPRSLGEAARAVLADCESIRFEPSPEAARTRDLADRTKKLVADLGRREAT